MPCLLAKDSDKLKPLSGVINNKLKRNIVNGMGGVGSGHFEPLKPFN